MISLGSRHKLTVASRNSHAIGLHTLVESLPHGLITIERVCCGAKRLKHAAPMHRAKAPRINTSLMFPALMFPAGFLKSKLSVDD